ncbi:MAG TPA: acyl-CoA thioesterase [Thermoanaerobaculia bacterium]|nr:acyl-CoA thioesterase [Thermoanaerobaculia bacterium]
MNLLLRLLFFGFASRRRDSITILDSSTIRLRVYPNDLDLNFHMNNGRYLSIMDVGRTDLLGRIGLLPILLRRKWFPIVGSATIQFLRPLNPFKKYDLTSRIVCWDEKWFYVEQLFEREGKVCAAGYIKGLLRGPSGNVTPREVAEALGSDPVSPAPPEWIVRWREWEQLKREL